MFGSNQYRVGGLPNQREFLKGLEQRLKGVGWVCELPQRDDPLRFDLKVKNTEEGDKQVILNPLWRTRSTLSYYEKAANLIREHYPQVDAVFFIAMDNWDPNNSVLSEGKGFELIYEWELLDALSRHLGNTSEADLLMAKNRLRIAERLSLEI